ncbi:MAG: methyltransferase domain-containing protein [Chloroflexota bacterium]|nr:methyltransferase domain-containing protein [Chloroflexota bacterium]
MTDQVETHASSTGQNMTGSAWLDVHFEVNRVEYEAQVRAVGIQPGWRVLDAGCGSGSFLPWLADLVGPTGQLAALDLAPDNIAVVEVRLAEWHLTTPIEARVGSVLTLPYPDANFDAVWCANTTQYLTNEELDTALAEMRRVVRPGGLVAIKEADPTLGRILPGPPGLMLRRIEAGARAGNVQFQGILRNHTLPAWLHKAGLVNVTRRTTLIERSAPPTPLARTMLHTAFALFASQAANLDLPETDRAFWASLRDPENLDRLLDDANFYSNEGNVLAVGQVPENERQAA